MKSFVAVVIAISLIAADWPQWRGANRDGHSGDTGLAKTWPAGGPKLAWSCKEAGIGYGQPAIVGDVIYLVGSKEDAEQEFVVALDAATGKPRWKTNLDIAKLDKGFNTNWGGGPRSTPAIDGDRLYVIGCQGDISCLETATGNKVWHKSMPANLGGRVMKIWGYSESPLVDGDVVVCTPGYGTEGVGTVAALDKKTGNVRWQSKELNEEATYSSLMIATIGNIKTYVGMTPKGAFGVAAKDGKLLWTVDKVGNNDIATIPTPIVSGNSVYVTSNYPGGNCALLNLKAADGKVTAEKVYSNTNLKNHHGGVILVGDHVYGANGNANQKKTLAFVCQNLKTGEVTWTEDSLEPSSICFADGRFIAYGQMTGKVVMFDATPKGFQSHGTFTVPEASKLRKKQGGVWTHPVVANGKLYLRDQELLFCYDVK